MKVNEKKKRAEDPQFVADITNIFYLQIAKTHLFSQEMVFMNNIENRGIFTSI